MAGVHTANGPEGDFFVVVVVGEDMVAATAAAAALEVRRRLGLSVSRSPRFW